MSLVRGFESEMESKLKTQKQLVEKTEQHQEQDLRAMSKKIRGDQVRVQNKFVKIQYNFTRD